MKTKQRRKNPLNLKNVPRPEQEPAHPFNLGRTQFLNGRLCTTWLEVWKESIPHRFFSWLSSFRRKRHSDNPKQA